MAVTIKGSGQVPVQVVTATNNSQLNSTSTTYVATALTATITPTNSLNRVAVNINGNLYGNMIVTVFRNGTDICNTAQGFMNSNVSNTSTASYTFIDSPSSTSALTYTVQMKAVSGSPWWNINSSQCVITLTEIAYA